MPFINPYKIMISEWKDRIFSYSSHLGPEDSLTEEFKNQIKEYTGIIIEVGSGSGQHLIELAKRNPNYAIIGFELRYKRSIRTLEKAKILGINNIYIIRGDAKFIAKFFEPGSLNKVYINFPDPWEKNARRKNRIISDEYLAILHSLLKAKGELSHKSDHKEYFMESLQKIKSANKFQILELTDDLHSSLYKENNILTEFEQLFLSQKLAISYILACKI